MFSDSRVPRVSPDRLPSCGQCRRSGGTCAGKGARGDFYAARVPENPRENTVRRSAITHYIKYYSAIELRLNGGLGAPGDRRAACAAALTRYGNITLRLT